MNKMHEKSSGGAGAMVIVQTAFEARDEAEQMARGLVEGRLAACVQVSGPVRSTYYWDEAVQCADEYVLTIKAPNDCAERIRLHIEAHHSYDTPEVVVVAAQSSSRYLSWARAVCR